RSSAVMSRSADAASTTPHSLPTRGCSVLKRRSPVRGFVRSTAPGRGPATAPCTQRSLPCSPRRSPGGPDNWIAMFYRIRISTLRPWSAPPERGSTGNAQGNGPSQERSPSRGCVSEGRPAEFAGAFECIGDAKACDVRRLRVSMAGGVLCRPIDLGSRSVEGRSGRRDVSDPGVPVAHLPVPRPRGVAHVSPASHGDPASAARPDVESRSTSDARVIVVHRGALAAPERGGLTGDLQPPFKGVVMPIIKPRTRGKHFVEHRTRLDRDNHETLYAYAAFVDED